MSLALDTPASERRDGRCVDCGRFTDRHTVHFHGPKRRFSGPPRAHLFNDGGGMVTRCDDPEKARTLLIAKYARDVLLGSGRVIGADEAAEAMSAFPEGQGRVERGRINVVAPDRDEVAWWWMRLDDDAKGPGVTTAVVWAS